MSSSSTLSPQKWILFEFLFVGFLSSRLTVAVAARTTARTKDIEPNYADSPVRRRSCLLQVNQMTSLDAALAWVRKGFLPVHVPHRSKRPVVDEWQRLEITADTVRQYFNGLPQNVGLLMGDKFGSTDVDCDCVEAITAARDLLPETSLIFGRQSGLALLVSI